MIVVNAAERNKMVKVVEATANMDWVFTSDRQIEVVLDKEFIRQLFNSRGVAIGDALRIVAFDGGDRCFCDLIVLDIDKTTGFVKFADKAAPGRPVYGVTVRRAPTPEEIHASTPPPVYKQQFVRGEGDVVWNEATGRFDVVVSGVVVASFARNQKTKAIAVAQGSEPIPAKEAA